MKSVTLALLTISFIGLFAGCAQMSASYKLGYENPKYKDRILKNGSNDYREYLELQKTAIPSWHKTFDEHGDPDYIIPGFGQNCKMVWMAENVTASPTTFGNVDIENGVPIEIKASEEQKKIVQQNSRNRTLRQTEDVLRENAELAYLRSVKGLATDSARYRVEKLEYSDSTKLGIITLVVEDADFVAARLWAKFYIEMMARDKNVAVVTGKTSEDGKYIMKDEKIIDGKTLVISFETL